MLQIVKYLPFFSQVGLIKIYYNTQKLRNANWYFARLQKNLWQLN